MRLQQVEVNLLNPSAVTGFFDEAMRLRFEVGKHHLCRRYPTMPSMACCNSTMRSRGLVLRSSMNHQQQRFVQRRRHFRDKDGVVRVYERLMRVREHPPCIIE